MRLRVSALLLVALGIVLGSTVFRDEIARAAGLAQGVFISNTPDQAVPVREQNLDNQGHIGVHEQGTANVNVTNASLPVHEQGTANVNVTNTSVRFVPQPSTETFPLGFLVDPGTSVSQAFGPIDASLVSLTSMRGEGVVQLWQAATLRLRFETDGGNVVLPLQQPLTLDRVTFICFAASPVRCGAQMNVIGT